MDTDKLVNRATAITVTLVALFAAVISYYHIIHIGNTHGGSGVESPLTALSIDGTILATSFVLLYCSWRKLTAPWLARVMLWMGVIATLACNVGYGLSYGPVGALFSGWPAVAFVGSVETILQLGKIKRNQPDRDAERAKIWEMEHLDDPIGPDLDLGQKIVLNEMEKRKVFDDEVKRITDPTVVIAPKAERKPRKRDGLSVANIQKAAHCDQKRATRIRDLIRDNGYDLDKAILIDEEAYPRKGKVTNERTTGNM